MNYNNKLFISLGSDYEYNNKLFISLGSGDHKIAVNDKSQKWLQVAASQ